MSKKPTIVDEGIPYGVYVWTIGGKPLVDEDFNYLVAPGRRNDPRPAQKLRAFVRDELGIDEGEPLFLEGQRPISQGEWEEQKAREAAGLVPDEYDLGNLIDEYNYEKEFGK